MSETVNKELCNERHGTLDKWVNKLEGRVKSVENRFFRMIVLLVANLAGVIAILLFK